MTQIVYRLSEIYLQIFIDLWKLAWMYFKVHRTNIDQETIEHGWAICANGHALLRKAQNPIFASEGRRDFSDTGKCSQWPHLYMTYEATCGLKCLFQEILSKNCFLRSVSWNFGCRLYIISLGGRTIGSQENWTMISIWMIRSSVADKNSGTEYMINTLGIEFK